MEIVKFLKKIYENRNEKFFHSNADVDSLKDKKVAVSGNCQIVVM